MKLKTMSLITGALLTIGVNGQGQTIPDKVDINLQQSNPALASQWEDRKEVKQFTHLAHITILEKNTDENVCQICHTEEIEQTATMTNDRKIKQQEAVALAGGIKEYMHGKCVTCHKTMKKENAVTGPTSCKGCH